MLATRPLSPSSADTTSPPVNFSRNVAKQTTVVAEAVEHGIKAEIYCRVSTCCGTILLCLNNEALLSLDITSNQQGSNFTQFLAHESLILLKVAGTFDVSSPTDTI